MKTLSIGRKDATALRLNGQGLTKAFSSAEDCIRACLGIQTQYSQSLPIAVAARTKPKPPQWFAKALDVGGPLRKTWTVRWTLHTVHEEDIPLLVSALGPRFHDRFVKSSVKYLGITEAALRKRDEQVWSTLRERPLTRKELHERISELKGLPGAGWGWDVAGLAYEGRLYISSHRGSATFVAAEPPKLIDEVMALGQLLKRYLSAFAPATRQDMQRWSGLYLSSIDRALESIENDLEWIEIEKSPGRFAVLKGQLDGQRRRGRLKLLPKFDVYVMAHKDKSLYLPECHSEKVFRPAGQVEATVMADGIVCGTWRANRKGKHLVLRIEPFERYDSGFIKLIEKEAEGVRVALGADRIECVCV